MTTETGIIYGIGLLLVLMLYVLWPEKNAAAQRQKTRLDFLEELREQIYTNLRDLNFEYQAGKYAQEDYNAQRAILEKEAAAVLAEMDQIEGAAIRTQRSGLRSGVGSGIAR
jgi:type II secretory pathway component PulM